MTDQTPAGTMGWLDGTAVALSALCLVHCLALPVLVAVLPLFAGLSDRHLHAEMLVVVVPVSVVALTLGFRRHRAIGVVAGGTLGLALMLIGATLAHAWLGLAADRLLTIAGAVVLAFAHWQNGWLSRRCRPPLNG